MNSVLHFSFITARGITLILLPTQAWLLPPHLLPLLPPNPLPPLPHHSPHFTPIQECEREEQLSKHSDGVTYKHHPTPLHHPSDKIYKSGTKKRHESCEEEDGSSVSCNKCRPHSRDQKISVVPLDNGNTNTRRKSPKSKNTSIAREEQWKIAVAELSNKLIQATRKRDEALSEASRLKYSMAQLEKKLNKLEVYCHNLKSGLEECSGNSPYKFEKSCNTRSTVRLFSRSLTVLLRHMGTKTYERISVLLQPYDIRISFSKNPKSLVFHLEALMNKAFFEDFESTGFQINAINQILNPIDRSEANFASFHVLKELTWEEVLSKGTRHFSEDFSRFCDRKMSEIVSMLGWNRAWPESLLQAFFNASKSVWLVHLLANSVHPGLPIFRVDKGVRFDSVYMEDMGGDRASKLVPNLVRIMVAPGFYVYGNVVKCKLVDNCHTHTSSHFIRTSTPSPSPSPASLTADYPLQPQLFKSEYSSQVSTQVQIASYNNRLSLDMKYEFNMGGSLWNDEDKAMIASVLGIRAFDYLISSSISNENPLIDECNLLQEEYIYISMYFET
ncbi:hypothetical protein Patl1_18576 [Pistacia atlantica]|uniref:Uncharacterized protein n=1 Tax=Pistacia atlantica TaxID=434234 RepID=A0ACC1BXU6_9ROSI|nr:hypothetical protein Patl1_18576 [Pistacia atlantica]